MRLRVSRPRAHGGSGSALAHRKANCGRVINRGACYYDTANNDCPSGAALPTSTRNANIQGWAANITAAGLPWLYWEVIPNADPHVSTSCVLLRAPPELRHTLFPFAVGRRLRGGRRGRPRVEHVASGRSERAERACGVRLLGISVVKAPAIYIQWDHQRSSYANIRVRVLTVTPQYRAAMP